LKLCSTLRPHARLQPGCEVPASALARAAIESPVQETPMRGVRRALKRIMDATAAAVLLLLTAPLIALLALLIKLQDGGPAFYRRRVVGLGCEFDAFKLRTMRVDADDLLLRNPSLRSNFEINFKLKDDPRVTPLGSYLRRCSLDELPQLWNVLRGQMSLVGPRMISPAELSKYGDAAWIFRSVWPGLTGYWQVEGARKESGRAHYQQRVAMDLFYVKNWSLALDLKILLKTPLRVLRGSERG
jgi:lipopolysaccharide/colanic/teichoic acid biosynthesis glycosyltransferase